MPEDAADDASDDVDPEAIPEPSGTNSEFRLKAWNQRRVAPEDGPPERPAPLIDRIHRLVYIWKAGDADKVDEFLTAHGLWQLPIFHKVLQALIEMASSTDGERTLLESISNHVSARKDRSGESLHPTLFS